MSTNKAGIPNENQSAVIRGNVALSNARVRPGAECAFRTRAPPLLRPSKVPSRKAPSLGRVRVRNVIGDGLSSYRLLFGDFFRPATEAGRANRCAA